MLYKIARKITKDYLDTLSFADRTGGLVRVMNDHRKSEKTYPTENNQDKVLGDKQYMRRLVPDSSLTSLMYWERGTEPDLVESHNRYNWYRATMRLVCWFNYQKVDPDMYDPAYLIAEIKNKIPLSLGSFECLTAVTCDFVGEEPNDGSVFSQYTYNEPDSQFFKYPYEHFVLNYEIEYRVVNDCYEQGLSDVPVDPILIEMSSGGQPTKTVVLSGVSGREYQIEAYDVNGASKLAKALHEYSGEDQTYTFSPTVIGNTFFKLDYGREYLLKIDCEQQSVQSVTIPDDNNIRLKDINFRNNLISVEQTLIDIIDHCYDVGLYNGTMDISGGSNAAITDIVALAKITEMTTNRGWTITHN